MQADESLVAYIATTYYNLSPILGSIKPLCGYSDKNFLLTDSNDHKTYVLKIVNKDESIVEVTEIIDEITQNAHAYSFSELPSTGLLPQRSSFVVPRIIRTTGDKLSTFTSVRYLTATGIKHEGCGQPTVMDTGEDLESPFKTFKCNIKLTEFFDGITMFDYINSKTMSSLIKPTSSQDALVMRNSKLRGEKLYRKLGRVCNELFVFMRTQRHLVDRLKVARGNSFPWQLKTCEPHLRQLLERLYPEKSNVRRLLIERVLKDYNKQVLHQLEKKPEFILHGDLCNKNILLNWDSNSPYLDQVCLIDFQDLQVGQQVIDLAVMMFYNVLEQEHLPFEKALKQIPRWIFAGYQSNEAASCQLDKADLLLVPILMKLRLCQSLLNGQLAFEEDPSNSYVMHTNQRGWQLLELMSDGQSEYGDSGLLARSWMKSVN